jgi:hypothetical protein
MIEKIYEAFKADPFINEKVGDRIKYYEYPAAGDVTGPYIIIDPLAPPTPGDYADNEWLTDEHLIQIEVWSKNRLDTGAIAKQIRLVMWMSLGFGQLSSGVNEWDKDLQVYRDARRYKGKTYIE